MFTSNFQSANLFLRMDILLNFRKYLGRNRKQLLKKTKRLMMTLLNRELKMKRKIGQRETFLHGLDNTELRTKLRPVLNAHSPGTGSLHAMCCCLRWSFCYKTAWIKFRSKEKHITTDCTNYAEFTEKTFLEWKTNVFL